MKNLLNISVLLGFLFLSNGAMSQDIIDSIKGSDEWQRLYLSSYKIDGEFKSYAYSSELDEVPAFEGGFGKYTILNLFDNDPATAWVEGVSGYGEGEKIVIGLGNNLPGKVEIKNGYQKSESIYLSNSRPKTIKITIYTGYFLEGDVTELASIYRIRELVPSFTFLMKDQMGIQEIPIKLSADGLEKAREKSLRLFRERFSEHIKKVKEYCPDCDDNPQFQYLIKLEIVDVYKGTRWDDTCISDFKAVYNNKKFQGIPSEDRIEEVYESDDMGSGIIFVDTDRERELILVDKSKMEENKLVDDETSFEIVLMDVSPDKEWAQLNIMFYEEGARRVEEYSILFHVRTLQRVDTTILKTQYGMFGFVEQDGKLYLDTADGLIDLEELRLKIKD